MKPLLKWVGGKSKLLDAIFSHVPGEMENYHEPFLGGGSVLFHLLSTRRHTVRGAVYASDANPILIGFYLNVQQRPRELIQHLKQLLEVFQSIAQEKGTQKPTAEQANSSKESFYYYTRERFNAIEDKMSVEASSLFFFLNKTCFRGVYREGPRGFNVPYGNYKNPSVYEEDEVLRVSELLQGVVFTHAKFEESLSRVKEGDFVYLDPPYAPEEKNSFVGYTKDGFTLEQHKTLFQMCRALPCKFLLSNASVELVHTEFAGYTITEIEARRAINSKNPEATTREVLVR
jgi:DNA adenine methylase